VARRGDEQPAQAGRRTGKREKVDLVGETIGGCLAVAELGDPFAQAVNRVWAVIVDVMRVVEL